MNLSDTPKLTLHRKFNYSVKYSRMAWPSRTKPTEKRLCF